MCQDKEIPEAAILSVEAAAVKKAVCAVYQISEQQLLASRRGAANVPRDLAIFALRMYSQKTLSEIGEPFGVKNYSTVSSAIDRAKKVLASEAKVRKEFKAIGLKLQ